MVKAEKKVVYLIGAGPGDPDLITIKGKEILQKCDVVIFDLLVPVELIFSLKKTTIKHFVGKKAGKHTLPQTEINELMVKYAKKGKSVARLKGGDPFLFGRGAEEARYLKNHNIKFEIIPGITAGLGATAYSGIACTDRNKSSFVIFATGHKAKKDSISVPWELIAKASSGTIVVYMVVSKISDIIEKLIKNGMPEKIPAAIIERGSLPTQRIITAPLSQLPQKAAANKIKPPSILVIGEVVNDQKTLYWLTTKPLLGTRIMISGSLEDNYDIYNNLRQLGCEVLPYPSHITKKYIDLTGWENFHKIKQQDKWLVFTNPDEINFFFEHYLNREKDIRNLHKFKIAASGENTRVTLKNYFILPDLMQKNNNINTLLNKIKEYPGSNNQTIVMEKKTANTKAMKIFLQQSPAKKIIKFLTLQTHYKLFCKWPDGLKTKLLENPPDLIFFPQDGEVEDFIKNLSTLELGQITANAILYSTHQNLSDIIQLKNLKIFKNTKKSNIVQNIKKIFHSNFTNKAQLSNF